MNIMDLDLKSIIAFLLKMMVFLSLILMDMLEKFAIHSKVVLVVMSNVVFNQISMAKIDVNNLKFVKVV